MIKDLIDAVGEHVGDAASTAAEKAEDLSEAVENTSDYVFGGEAMAKIIRELDLD